MYAKSFMKHFLAQDKESCSGEKSSNVSSTVKENDNDIAETPLVKSASSVSELIDVLTARIDDNNQFLVIWRGATLKHQLTIWDRQSKKKSPTMKLMVHFAEEGRGLILVAIHKEFLLNISREMFPNRPPIDSTLKVHNGWFRICGEIVVVSLVNGGPPPCSFSESLYRMLVDLEP